MARFRFRLATLLRLRELTRDERRAALAQAFQAEDLVRKKQEELGGELAALAGFCRQTSAAGELDVDAMLAARRYEMVLRAQFSHLDQQRAAIGEEIERRRAALVEATREVRVLEQLREHQQQRHRDAEQHEEMKQLDDIAGQRWRREVE
jgi:flagellar export protein FliJ